MRSRLTAAAREDGDDEASFLNRWALLKRPGLQPCVVEESCRRELIAQPPAMPSLFHRLLDCGVDEGGEPRSSDKAPKHCSVGQFQRAWRTLGVHASMEQCCAVFLRYGCAPANAG